MATDINELKQAAEKEVTSPVTQRTFRIYKLDPYAYIRARMAPIIPTKEQMDAMSDVEKDKAATDFAMTKTQHVLEAGAGVFFGKKSEVPEGQIHISWIPEDSGWLSDEILKFSGFDDESRKRIEDLLKNANGSGTSTKSDARTADSQASRYDSGPSIAASIRTFLESHAKKKQSVKGRL